MGIVIYFAVMMVIYLISLVLIKVDKATKMRFKKKII